ncbi:MAG TPA: TonB-dependent receptor [Dinghuibacter sp.]|uniref:TonB-dependent receptor n=1 Tax=Dinghuibacter sp. TaxID=2024697 RepID=UPI002B818185|nr:TonB-dependent receptor [Dinghuibacter sp.]HTJ13920.1 TonB-dependent receptor [Dinghuibacter sp.]
MRHFLRLACLLLTLTITARAGAQRLETITGDFRGIRFPEFVTRVEASTDFRFYYIPSALDTMPVSLTANNSPLDSVLEEVLDNTPFRFAIDSLKRVFVWQGSPIQTRLAAGYYGKSDTVRRRLARRDNALAENQSRRILHAAVDNRLYTIGSGNATEGGRVTVAGYIRDAASEEPVIGAAVQLENTKTGTSTDQYGFYSLTLSRGRHTLRITSVGMQDVTRHVLLLSDGRMDVDMPEFVPILKTVVVDASKTVNVQSTRMGFQKLDIATIKQVPAVLGEPDVLRVVLTLPGVTSASEGSTGLNVRGGAADQNLVLFNDATIYNPSHFFGFFTAFNPDAVKDVQLYKSSIPERYGGRLASVLDVTGKEGNKKKFSGSGGVGPLDARLTLEGPIDSNKVSYLVSGRTTYSNWILRSLNNRDYADSRANFYDVNAHISAALGTRNTIYVTGYLSHDGFRLDGDTTYTYGNRNANIKWKHLFGSRTTSTVTAAYDHYQFGIASQANEVNAYSFKFSITQWSGRLDFTTRVGTKHTLDYGLNAVRYGLQPGNMQPDSKSSLVLPVTVSQEQALESAAYLGDHFIISPSLTIDAGLRYSLYEYLGPHQEYTYAAGLPRQTDNITDSTTYGAGSAIKRYSYPEVRISGRLVLSPNSSIKAGFNTLAQYIHMMSNTTAISPTDIWKLSDPYIQPEIGKQWSLGYYHNLASNSIEVSGEVYYKQIDHYLDYKSGAVLLLNNHLETDVINTHGKSYGAEIMVRKTTGKLNGWISYTWSRTRLQSDDPLAESPVNEGRWYPSDFDKPNILNVVGNYKFTHRIGVSLNVAYSTGRPITLPIGEYYLGGSYRTLYSDRNQYRVPDYFRTDLAVDIEGTHRIKVFAHSSWTLGVYNLTARKNPYSIYYSSENGVVNGYKLSIFGTAIPFVTYNFRF